MKIRWGFWEHLGCSEEEGCFGTWFDRQGESLP